MYVQVQTANTMMSSKLWKLNKADIGLPRSSHTKRGNFNFNDSMDENAEASHNSTPSNSQLNASSLNILGVQATPPSTRTLGLAESMIAPSVEPHLADGFPSGIVRSQLPSFGENIQDADNGDISNPQGLSAERLRVIWGTNIVISDAISSFKTFLQTFTLAHRSLFEKRVVDRPNDYEPMYPKLLEQV